MGINPNRVFAVALGIALALAGAAGSLLMGPIGTRLFGIAPKVNPMMSMLQNMLN